MTLPRAILDLENRSLGPDGEPTLGRALELAVAEWHSGNRDRELRLHLLFLSWYCLYEPPYLTGADDSITLPVGKTELFQSVYETFAPGIMDDVECLYIVGLMSYLTPDLLGGVVMWEGRSAEFRRRYRALLPSGLPAAWSRCLWRVFLLARYSAGLVLNRVGGRI